MKRSELKDKAMRIATGNMTTETLGYKEYSDMTHEELGAIAWQPFENWDTGDYAMAIEQLAEDIERSFNKYVTEED